MNGSHQVTATRNSFPPKHPALKPGQNSARSPCYAHHVCSSIHINMRLRGKDSNSPFAVNFSSKARPLLVRRSRARQKGCSSPYFNFCKHLNIVAGSTHPKCKRFELPWYRCRISSDRPSGPAAIHLADCKCSQSSSSSCMPSF